MLIKDNSLQIQMEDRQVGVVVEGKIGLHSNEWK